MSIYILPLLLILLSSAVSAYLTRQGSIVPRSIPAIHRLLTCTGTPHHLSGHENDNDEPKLLLSFNEVEAQMKTLRSKYPTSEADYLAAARARNAAKVSSSERTASDDDWREIAAEKKRAVGEIDDWENSISEAGNVDSKILIPLTSGDSEDGDDEPKLMLF